MHPVHTTRARVPWLLLPMNVGNGSVPLLASESALHRPVSCHARKQCRTAHGLANGVECQSPPRTACGRGERAL